MQDSNSIKQAFPEFEPTDSIRSSARQAVAGHIARHRRTARTRRTVLVALATCLLVTGGIVAGPPAYGYYKMQRIAGSVEDCRSAVLQRFHVDENGAAHPAGRILYANGHWRIEDGHSVQVYADKTLWIYDPATNEVTKMFRPDGPFGYNHTGFSIQAMIADHKRWNWRARVSSGSGAFE